ncbi:MAG: hypothetical protein IJV37_05630 [Bacteroidales bacterium]|nr:hypothetical protein [Bacteroidales bacterium]
MLTKHEQREYLACLRRAVELAELGGYTIDQVRIDFTLLKTPPHKKYTPRIRRGSEAVGNRYPPGGGARTEHKDRNKL